MNEILEAKIRELPGEILDIMDTTKERLTVMHDSLYKVIVVGDTAIGKTSLLWRLKTKEYTDEHETTIGVENSKFEMLLGDQIHTKLQLWDTAGQESFRSITRMFYKDSDAIIVCFSLLKRESFESLEEWMNEIDRHADSSKIIKYLVGNCADQVEDEPSLRKVSHQEAI